MALKKGRSRGFMRGASAMAHVDEELAREKAAKEARKSQVNMPFRVWVPPGETKEVIVLDDKPDFFMYEHQVQNPRTKKWDTYLGCTKAFDVCPVCEETGKESYYAMYLSVIDLTPFKDRSGVNHRFSRKLMMVKNLSQQKKFIRRFEKDGTLRGYKLELNRDSDKDPTIGGDIEFVEIIDETELAKYKRRFKDRDGKVHQEDCSVPFVYDELFEEPDSDKLRAIVGGEPIPGSSKANHKALDEEEWGDDYDEDEEEAEAEEAKPKRPPSSAVASKKRPIAVDEDEDEEEESDDPPWEEEEAEEDEEEEEAPPVKKVRGSRLKGALRGARK
jgi:hypothetical protein